MFELHKRYKVAMPKGHISETGITLIKQYISAQRLSDDIWQARNPGMTRQYLTPLPDDWSYVWVITGRGEYVGTFPKRVSKYYYQTYNVKCPNEFLQELGNIARQHSDDEKSYTIDITDNLDWHAGEFGDSGSCLWGSNSEGREIMQDNGVMGIRFYDDNGDGYGRAWLYQPSEGFFVIWGGYGVNGGTLAITRVFSVFLGLSYKRISLENRGHSDGLVWINSGIGYLVGAADSIAGTIHYDLDFDVPICCDECGREMTENTTYYTPDDRMVCEDCFYDMADYCACCGESCWRENLYYVADGYDVCEYCLEHDYTRCDKCEEYYRNHDVVETKDGHFCENCQPE